VIPVIDVTALRDPCADRTRRTAVARELDDAAHRFGFFYVVGHGVDPALIDRLARLARAFFALDEATKMRTPMSAGGRAWRGYFPLGDELTSDRPDWKEGLYLGTELDPADPRVRSGTILHGRNLWPAIEGFRDTVLAYIDALTILGHCLMGGLARGLGLDERWFAERYTADPLVLLRLFNYPGRPVPAGSPVQWGVGEHTDYGLLTLLWQDDVGGLQIRTDEGWIDAPPTRGSFVCNVGDMLDFMTDGHWQSVPHRVTINATGRDRLSIPLFFDPAFEARVQRVPLAAGAGRKRSVRWDGADLRAFEGTYGDYVTAKVAKVFPQLHRAVT
jgi:polar amino acid transport system ATP-binding protein